MYLAFRKPPQGYDPAPDSPTLSTPVLVTELPDSPPENGPSRKALSRGLSEFLIEFSIGVNRYAMYPAGHPSLAPAVDGILRRLVKLFTDRRSLNIGVARRQLVIEGVATEVKHPVLSELARRLHDFQIGAITFETGVGPDEILGVLGALGTEPEPDDTPLGLLDPGEIPSWPHIHLHPLGYERLGIKDGDTPGARTARTTQLWLGLAQAALAGADDDAEIEPEVIAKSIEGHHREAAYDQVIVGYMLQLAEALKTEQGAEAERVRERMAALMRELDDDTLARLVELGGDFEARKRFVLDANQGLAVDAVIKVLQAAATATRQTVSTSMTRLLSKLATHAGDGEGRLQTQARDTLLENVEELMTDWELEDPNPEEYTRVLDRISRSSPLFDRPEDPDDDGTEDGPDSEADRGTEELSDDDMAQAGLPGSLRVIQMALEVEAFGPTVQACVQDLVSMGRTGELVDLLQSVDSGNGVVEQVVAELTDPDQVRRYLDLADVESRVLQALATSGGEAMIPHFLQALAEAESRSVRRKVFDVAKEMGPAVGDLVLEALAGEERWFVIRNFLALLDFMPEAAQALDLLPFLQHQDARVRREALPLALARPDLRDRGLAIGLKDQDERVVRNAVAALPTPLPQALVPTVIKRVLEAEHPPQVKAVAIRTLTGVRTPLARDALLRISVDGRSLLGKLRIADRDASVLAALQVLTSDWAEDGEVAPLLRQARRSKDPEVVRAVEMP